MKPISLTFQGATVNALTVREILERMLGAKAEDGVIKIDATNPILDTYPRVLEDDGMGYGVNPKHITDVDTDTYDANIRVLDMPKEVLTLEEFDKRAHIEVVKSFNVWAETDRAKQDDEEY